MRTTSTIYCKYSEEELITHMGKTEVTLKSIYKTQKLLFDQYTAESKLRYCAHNMRCILDLQKQHGHFELIYQLDVHSYTPQIIIRAKDEELLSVVFLSKQFK